MGSLLLVPWKRNLKVPVEPFPWPQGTRERMSINSFGLGGSNVHVSTGSASRLIIGVIRCSTSANPPFADRHRLR
jgi:hypothetical protein